MDDVLRRLERDRDAGDVDAGLRWSAERRRRGMCGLVKCEVGLTVDITETGRAELLWGSRRALYWVWSIDRVEDRPDYPEELTILLNSQSPVLPATGYPSAFVFWPTPFGVMASGPCHECMSTMTDPQEVVIDPGPRWGSRVPLWMRRSEAFAKLVAEVSKPPHQRMILDYADPTDIAFPAPGERLRERRRIRHEVEWQEWRCGAILERGEDSDLRCGSYAGRAIVVGDGNASHPFVVCPACGTRGPTSLLPYAAARPVRWRPRPTHPPSPSPPARSGS